MADKIKVEKWEHSGFVSGAKRANLEPSEWLPDWFVGFGKDESCQMNVDKLWARYPDGFDPNCSLNRKAGDV